MKTFESLYRDYYQKVYAFLNRMCADGDLAEDLTQETFLQAYKSLYKFRGECEVFTWLAAIGKHTYFKYLKKKRLHLDAANLDLVAQNYLRENLFAQVCPRKRGRPAGREFYNPYYDSTGCSF